MDGAPVRQWCTKADRDLGSAERRFAGKDPLTDAACLHCRQCVEKYLKAYLLWRGTEIERTHDLERLPLLCAAHDPTLRDLDLGDLTSYAVAVRCPDAYYIPTVEEAREAPALTRAARQAARGRIAPPSP